MTQRSTVRHSAARGSAPVLDHTDPRVVAILERVASGEIGWREATVALGISTADYYAILDAMGAAGIRNHVPAEIFVR